MAESFRINKVSSSGEKGLIEVLSESPLENAFLLGLLHDFGVRALERYEWGWFYSWFCDGEFGVVFVDTTGLLVATQKGRKHLHPVLEHLLRANHRIRRVICPTEPAEIIHQTLQPMDHKFSQPYQCIPESGMYLTEGMLIKKNTPDLQLANLSDVNIIAWGAAQAIEEELGVRVESSHLVYLCQSKTDLIQRGRYYIMKDGMNIVFQAYFSTRNPEVAQIQGVWVPPNYRRHGIATDCMSEMCAQGFKHSQRIVLRVQKRNTPAIRVYEKNGFKPFMDYLSIWYDNHLY